MKDDLQNLIRLLEDEQKSLRKLIKEAVAEHEFQIAHFHCEAIGHVNRQLQTFRNLADPAYDKKKWLKRSIRVAEKQLKMKNPKALKKYFREEIIKNRKELELISRTEYPPLPEDGKLQACLFQLFEGRIKCIKLMLMKSKNFYLEIRRYKRGVKITIPNLKNLANNFTINDDELIRLKGIGFEHSHQETRMTLILSERKNLIEAFNYSIFKIVFEIFYFEQFSHDSYIELLPARKPGR